MIVGPEGPRSAVTRWKTAGDGERTVVGFGPEMENAQWRAREWSTAAGSGVFDDGRLTVRRGDQVPANPPQPVRPAPPLKSWVLGVFLRVRVKK